MRKKLREMPLYQKSEEIYRTVKTICDLIPEENKVELAVEHSNNPVKKLKFFVYPKAS